MRPIFYVLAMVAVIGTAFFAYREHLRTLQAMNERDALEREIRDLRRAVSVQRAEWAFLTRPDRLRELANANFDRLGLLPMTGEQFGLIAQVPYPMTPLLDLSAPIETMSAQE
jgi:hypothetical protein